MNVLEDPAGLAELQALFLKEAGKYHVLPMDDRVFERLDGAAVGRPDLMGGRKSMTLAEGIAGMMEGVFINVKNRSKTITAEVEVPAGAAVLGPHHGRQHALEMLVAQYLQHRPACRAAGLAVVVRR